MAHVARIGSVEEKITVAIKQTVDFGRIGSLLFAEQPENST